MIKNQSIQTSLIEYVGAGVFDAHIRRTNDPSPGNEYDIRLDIHGRSVEGSVQLSCSDIFHLTKLMQLMLTEIALDGHANQIDRPWIRCLKNHLERAINEIESASNNQIHESPILEIQNDTSSRA